MTTDTIDRHDPDAVVRAAALAMHEERWTDVAALCDADALEDRRDVLRDRLRAWRDHATLRARYGVPDDAQLQALPALEPPALFARELACGSPRAQARALLGDDAERAVLGAEIRFPLVRVLGHVRERFYGRELAHVLTRLVHPHGPRDPHAPAHGDAPVDAALAADMPVIVTIVVRAADGRWAIVPDDDLLGLRRWSVAILSPDEDIVEQDWEGERPDP